MNRIKDFFNRLTGPSEIEVFSDKQPKTGAEKDAALARELLAKQSTGVETKVAQPVQPAVSRRRVAEATAAIKGTIDERTNLSIPSGVSHADFLKFLALTPNRIPTQDEVNDHFNIV